MTKNDAIVYHALVDGITVPVAGADPLAMSAVGARVIGRGEEIAVDAEFVEATRDRLGDSWADDLSEAAQVKRWGVARFREGALESNTVLAEKLAEEREAEAAKLAQANLIEAKRYGRGRKE